MFAIISTAGVAGMTMLAARERSSLHARKASSRRGDLRLPVHGRLVARQAIQYERRLNATARKEG
jgi:hypothetical protein